MSAFEEIDGAPKGKRTRRRSCSPASRTDPTGWKEMIQSQLEVGWILKRYLGLTLPDHSLFSSEEKQKTSRQLGPSNRALLLLRPSLMLVSLLTLIPLIPLYIRQERDEEGQLELL